MTEEFYQGGLTPEARRGYAKGMIADGGSTPESARPNIQEGLSDTTRAFLEEGARLAAVMDDVGDNAHLLSNALKQKLRSSQSYKEEEEDANGPKEERIKSAEGNLDKVLKDVRGESDETIIARDGQYVLGLGRQMLEYAKVQADAQKTTAPSEAMKKALEEAGVDKLIEKIEQAQNRGKIDSVKNEIAELSGALKKFIHNPELKEFSYMDVPSSFEELMQYIAFSEDRQYQPGGEFALYKVEYKKDSNALYVDSEGYATEPILDPYGQPTGRFKRIEIVVPNYQNLRHWTKDKAKYFIGQNTFTAINLMQEVSVPALNPLSIGYILNNDRFWISANPTKRVPVEEEISTREEYIALKEDGKNVSETPDGRYVHNKNVYVVDREKTKELENLRDDLILTLVLTDWEHNSHVAYATEGMVSEKPLREAMQKIYTSNYLTRFLNMELHEASDSEYHNPNGHSEVAQMLEKGPMDMEKQGMVGKAKQRGLAAYMFLAEGNATANGWTIEGGVNPFEEVLRAEGTNESERFYKSLVRQTVDVYYKKEIEGVKALVDVLNKTEWPGRSNHPHRYDWEKVDLVDFLFLGRAELLQRLAKLKITEQQLNEAKSEALKKYDDDSSLSNEKREEMRQTRSRVEQQLQIVGKDGAKKKFLEMFANQVAVAGQPKMEFTQDDISENISKDPNAPKAGAFYKFFKAEGYEGIDAFGVNFYARPYDPNNAKDANIFRNVRYPDEARVIVRQALADVLVHTEKLSNFEAWWAEERAFRKTYFTGIAARNDVDAIGFDAQSKVLNTMAYRIRQANRAGNFYGMPDNIFGPLRLGVNMWEGINAKRKGESGYKKPLYQFLCGIEETTRKDEKTGQVVSGIEFHINDDIGQLELPGNSMKQFFADHFGNALSLWEAVQGPEGLGIVAKFGHYDNQGNFIIDYKAMKDFMDGLRKQSTYTYDNASIQYSRLYAGWRQVTYLSKDLDGHPVAKTEMVFGVRSLKDFMFSHEIQEMGMYERKDLAGPKGIKRGEEEDKMARNVLAYLLAKELEAHQAREGHAVWNADAIVQVADALRKYGIGIVEMGDEQALFVNGFFNAEELERILATAQIILWKLYVDDYKSDALGGLADGIFGIFSDLMKELGTTIKT